MAAASRGRGVYVETLGAALMTGEFVRFSRATLSKDKNHVGLIVDIKHFSELPAAEARVWSSADSRCRTASFLKIRWAAIVGDRDGCVKATETVGRWPSAVGAQELVLRDVISYMPADNVIGVLLVVFPEEIASGDS